ncbi:transmembrane protein [Mycobacterium lentiflavum]|uniref:SPW repeat protein n=1 Tax=Mycobacterium lentiflavum TaxID=141349 RepID=A0A0E3WB56_MYCLN|nr:SPW repeat protein [Mycobacterium lentiflavum]MEE3065882.1 SPW repeat protein [Actinomycetota bacterium]ULP42820.1 SPW repeat protein [Mycobacterium lentiflavum]CQD04017.1 transmembrane protein [Mycobacterium lentiflavum]
MSTVHSSIDHHPDLLALRARYERVAESVSAHVTFGLALLTGLYVAASPWIVGFSGTAALAASDFIVGIALAFLAYGFATTLDRAHGMTWTLPVLGLWVFVSPWVVTGVALTTGTIWSHVVAGALLTFLGLNAAYFGMRTRAAADHA